MARFAQGIYKLTNPQKYVGKGLPRYRSGWEWSFFTFCDNDDRILEWASEAIKIPYRHPLTGKMTIYVPDVLIKYRTADNLMKVDLIEIKPKSQSVIFNETKSQERAMVAINYAKWDAASRWAKNNGLTFRVLTEDDLFHQGRQRSTRRKR